jgi:hypothetical protein
MLRHMALVRTDVSEEDIPSIIGVTRIGELGTTLAVTSNRRLLAHTPRLGEPVIRCIVEERSSRATGIRGNESLGLSRNNLLGGYIDI